MKNSTLLRLFFISIGLPLTCASSTPKPKPDALILRDTSNNAPAIQLEGAGTEVPSVSGEISVSGIEDAAPKDLEALISSGEYEAVIKLGDGMDKDKFLKHLCQVVTSLDQLKGLFGYLKQRDMVPGFLAHGDMVLVRKVIVETDLLETHDLDRRYSIYDAIALSLKEDSHNRVAGLFEAIKGSPAWESEFNRFVYDFFGEYPPEDDSMPPKRFLTLHREELGKQHSEIFESICQRLVLNLKFGLGNPASQKSLIDLVGQPSLLTPVAFAEGFLSTAIDTSRTNFIKYSYREAIEEGLKEKYPGGGKKLWRVMVNEFQSQFSGEYPTTDEERAAALRNFKPTKQDREDTWAVNNASNPQTRLRAKQQAEFIDKFGINVPIVLWVIVAEYATVPTWLDTE